MTWVQTLVVGMYRNEMRNRGFESDAECSTPIRRIYAIMDRKQTVEGRGFHNLEYHFIEQLERSKLLAQISCQLFSATFWS